MANIIGGPPTDSHLARNLQIARECRGMTQRQLGRLARLQCNTINYIESGYVKDPRGSFILRIAEVLQVKPRFLYYGTEVQMKRKSQ